MSPSSPSTPPASPAHRGNYRPRSSLLLFSRLMGEKLAATPRGGREWPRCHLHWPLTEFPPNKWVASGVSSRCRSCLVERSRRWRAEHRDQVNAARRVGPFQVRRASTAARRSRRRLGCGFVARTARGDAPSSSPLRRFALGTHSSLEGEHRREGFGLVAIDVEPNLGDLPVIEAIDGDLVSLGPPSLTLGRPSDEHGGVIDSIQERLRLELRRPAGDCDQLLEESYDLFASSVTARVILLAWFVPADLVPEERADGVPVTSRTCLVCSDGAYPGAYFGRKTCWFAGGFESNPGSSRNPSLASDREASSGADSCCSPRAARSPGRRRCRSRARRSGAGSTSVRGLEA